MGGDAVARLEVVLSVVADLREAGVAAAEPARPLLAAVVPAACVLAEVAADGALVAQERRGGETGRRRDRRVRRASESDGEVGQRRRGADLGDRRRRRSMPPSPASCRSTSSEGARDAAVDLPGEVGAAREHSGAVLQRAARAPRPPRPDGRRRSRAAPPAPGRASAAAPLRAARSRARTRSRSPPRSG